MDQRKIIKSAILISMVLVSCQSITVAQGGSIYGKVFLPGGSMLNERAKITLQTDRGIKSTVFTDDRGQFEFKSLTPAIYEIVIDADPVRFETAHAKVEVFPSAPSLVNITLKDKKPADAKGGGVVTVGELDPAVPVAARKEFQKAGESAQAGKVDDAIGHLRKAISIYPRYLMALNDLGTYLLSQGKLEEAAAQFTTAIDVDPKAFNPRLNLGIVLVQQKQFAKAAEWLKSAIAINGESPAARLYNGYALEGLNDQVSATSELESAHTLGGANFAVALFHLGQIYARNGDRMKARQMFEQYLKESPNGPDANESRRMVRILGGA
jgi:tetratricopeptide (TPR) repeat protein